MLQLLAQVCDLLLPHPRSRIAIRIIVQFLLPTLDFLAQFPLDLFSAQQPVGRCRPLHTRRIDRYRAQPRHPRAPHPAPPRPDPPPPPPRAPPTPAPAPPSPPRAHQPRLQGAHTKPALLG